MRSPKEKASLAEAVSHPLRVRILEVLNEVDMSASDFVSAGHADFYFGHRPTVSHVAYHFRELADFGCLEDVAWRKTGGSVATVYRGAARVEFGDEAWAELPEDDKKTVSRTIAQGLIARIDGAFMAETFHKRDDTQLSWFSMRLDERGWKEVHDILARAFAEVDEARDDAKARLDEIGDEGLTATAGIIFFESPSLPGSPLEGSGSA